jgi:hypothetical protein
MYEISLKQLMIFLEKMPARECQPPPRPGRKTEKRQKHAITQTADNQQLVKY